MEVEDLPLQVALLTMEVAEHRKAMARLSAVLDMAGRMAAMPELTLRQAQDDDR
jgi:hypothetical protein